MALHQTRWKSFLVCLGEHPPSTSRKSLPAVRGGGRSAVNVEAQKKRKEKANVALTTVGLNTWRHD
jgi:hypothetical protein